MPNRKKLSLALKTAAEISGKTEDLRGIMEKMSGVQREMFKDLIKGDHIIKVFIKRKLLKELAERVPMVTRIDGIPVHVEALTWRDYKELQPYIAGSLVKAARDILGRDYQKFIVDIKWMFKMLSYDAMRVVVGIMEDKEVSPQTRLSAAQDILNRGGFEGTRETPKEHFPVNVVIRYDKKPVSDSDVIEAETYANPE